MDRARLIQGLEDRFRRLTHVLYDTSVKPADLTRLITKKDRGEFPAERVRQSIDGRAEVAGHGYREMPVWGDVFQPMDSEMSEPEKVDVAKRKIAELVAYLRTLQAPAEEGGG